jgi:hypothetical protein
MRYVASFLFGLVAFASIGQVVAPVPATVDPKTMTLQERYAAMKKTAD